MKQSDVTLINLLKNRDTNSIDNEQLKEFKPPKITKLGNKYEFSLNFKTHIFEQGTEILPINLTNRNLKTYFPLIIFGLTDYFSSYYTSNNFILKEANPWNLYTNGIWGFQFFASPPIIPNNGDFYTRFIYNQPTAPFHNFESYTVLSSSSQIGYGTILNNLADIKYIINSIKIIVPRANFEQFKNPLIISKLSISGKLKTEFIDLLKFVTPDNFNKNIVDIPLKILLDKNLIINWGVNYDCQDIHFIFNLTQVI